MINTVFCLKKLFSSSILSCRPLYPQLFPFAILHLFSLQIAFLLSYIILFTFHNNLQCLRPLRSSFLFINNSLFFLRQLHLFIQGKCYLPPEVCYKYLTFQCPWGEVRERESVNRIREEKRGGTKSNAVRHKADKCI